MIAFLGSEYITIFTNFIFGSLIVLISTIVNRRSRKTFSKKRKEDKEMDVMTISFNVPKTLTKLVDDGKLTKMELFLIIACCSEVKIEGVK